MAKVAAGVWVQLALEVASSLGKQMTSVVYTYRVLNFYMLIF